MKGEVGRAQLPDPPQALKRRGVDQGNGQRFGWVLAIATSVPLVAASAYYYLGTKAPGQTGIGVPDLAVLLDILAWAGREHPIVLIKPSFLKLI